ncbi:hypothetical protein KSP40_PGU019348 [Platanthera guangdongensis]|uniref:Amine oxidase domain-containing protein n=1 Tax=Platanthera guangdongensis TaxID=2320717 RepID=A0ABR2MWP9_9ASPA
MASAASCSSVYAAVTSFSSLKGSRPPCRARASLDSNVSDMGGNGVLSVENVDSHGQSLPRGSRLSIPRLSSSLAADDFSILHSIDVGGYCLAKSELSSSAPKGLFPPEPEHYRGPKLRVAIIGSGLAGMSTAVELLDQGHMNLLGGSILQVDIYESRPFIGGKVGSFVDKRGNHIEMGLHVFFGCYSNLFRLMKKIPSITSTSFARSRLHAIVAELYNLRFGDNYDCLLHVVTFYYSLPQVMHCGD